MSNTNKAVGWAILLRLRLGLRQRDVRHGQPLSGHRAWWLDRCRLLHAIWNADTAHLRRNRRAISSVLRRARSYSVAFCFVRLASRSAVWQGGVANSNWRRRPTIGETKEFSLATGLFVAVLAGILSACFRFWPRPPANQSPKSPKHTEPNPLYSNNVVLIAVLTGGFLSNGLSCLVMNLKQSHAWRLRSPRNAYLPNALLAWLSGVTWFCQFFFYGMGQTKLGKQFEFSSWSIHMAFIVVFLNLWGSCSTSGAAPRSRPNCWSGSAF